MFFLIIQNYETFNFVVPERLTVGENDTINAMFKSLIYKITSLFHSISSEREINC